MIDAEAMGGLRRVKSSARGVVSAQEGDSNGDACKEAGES